MTYPAHERLHAGVRGQWFPEHLDGQLLGHPVELRARVLDGEARQHHPVGRSSDEHQHRVRDGALGAMHLAQSTRSPTPSTLRTRAATYNECSGPYEKRGAADSATPETGDALCY